MTTRVISARGRAQMAVPLPRAAETIRSVGSGAFVMAEEEVIVAFVSPECP